MIDIYPTGICLVFKETTKLFSRWLNQCKFIIVLSISFLYIDSHIRICYRFGFNL